MTQLFMKTASIRFQRPSMAVALVAFYISSFTPASAACGMVAAPSVPIPPGAHVAGLSGSSSSDLWAVGGTSKENGHETVGEAIANYWNGRRWIVVPTAPLRSTFSVLNSVVSLSPVDAWAVGFVGVSDGPGRALIEHWNGSAWTVVSSGTSDHIHNELNSVKAITPNDVWAVGYSGVEDQGSLVEHWDGVSWSLVPSQHARYFSDVAASGTRDAWAVGGRAAEHWNGRFWRSVRVPEDSEMNTLNAVVVPPSHDVWAFGSWLQRTGHCGYGGSCPVGALIEHRNGSLWQRMALTNFEYGELLAAATTPSGDVWAVGDNGGFALALHLNGGWTQGVQNAITGKLVSVAAPTDGSVWFVSADGQLEQYSCTLRNR